ncbi:MAG: 50S ribosomal protein L32 [Candidatus Latescibacteria bacterium]|nr:50S ribosomal protein L32 [Candidatus Latescibacterota bacterium]
MALPKRRHSRSRQNMRRAHQKFIVPAVTTCSHCSQPKLSHRVCQNCGYYDGRETIQPKEA